MAESTAMEILQAKKESYLKVILWLVGSLNFLKKEGQRPVPTQSIQNVGGPQVGVIYGKMIPLVPIGTTYSMKNA